ncbi:MAG: prepilin-type cleavage/methylation domain-containing protein [Betaproteobacteria bacterium HGW-Betaproteobacteria-8]|nr:MAG: prepilin-type cleavage/methylation domain-containing protein [Betaproteobacteria bacterium HGW-Betaproteobacteria-8]
MKKQSGFTLIELAIVLVIIGLLLGGVLKGQELINSAKAKNIASELKNAQIFIYGYQDKFRAIPGDDQNVTRNINGATRATTPVATLGNAQINGLWNSVTATDESFLFWQHVRLAGLATGPTNVADANYLPRNADGGRVGVQGTTGFVEINGLNTAGQYVVCSENIVGRLVKQIDVNLDDGESSTGALRAIVAGAPAPVLSANIVDGNPYTICFAF